MSQRYVQIAIFAALTIGCGSHDKPDSPDTPKASKMTETKEFDFLAEDIGTRELYAQHRGDGPEMISTLRAALRKDARPTVRQNAIVALTASTDPARLDDFIFALDDGDPAVVSEAGFSIAAMVSDVSLSEAPRTRAVAALRAHSSSLQKAFGSPRERVRYNVMMSLQAAEDREFDISKALGDGASLVQSQGLALAIARANADHKLSAYDLEALIAFATRTKDPQFRDDTMDLLVRLAPEEAGQLLIKSIADDSIGYRGMKYLVDLHLTTAVPAIMSYIKKHPGQWSAEHLQTLADLRATCAAPLMAELFDAERDKVKAAWITDAIRVLSDLDGASAKDLVAWARRQKSDVAPCQ